MIIMWLERSGYDSREKKIGETQNLFHVNLIIFLFPYVIAIWMLKFKIKYFFLKKNLSCFLHGPF